MTYKPRTLAQTIAFVVTRNLVTVLAGVVAFLFVAMLPARLDYAPTQPPAYGADESPAADLERLLAEHDCWTGPADEPKSARRGVMPTGVVMALAGEGPRYFGTDARVGQALDHIFAAPDPRIGSVVGFCK